VFFINKIEKREYFEKYYLAKTGDVYKGRGNYWGNIGISLFVVM